MAFPQAPAGARRILGGWRRSGWLWCYGRSCWWCSRRMTKRSSPAGSGRKRRGPVREGYKVVALLLKPSLGLFGLVSRRRVLLPHTGSATGHLIASGDHHTLQHIQVTFWCWLASRLRRCEVAWYGWTIVSVLHMTSNCLIVGLLFWSSGECGVSLHF